MEPDTVTLDLGDFDRHGTTRARYQGRWIEVEHGIPGELVRAEVIGGKRPRARIVEVIEADPDRVTSPCPYFREWACGGCQWQQISYPGQLARKRKSVDDLLEQSGLGLSVTRVHSADPWGYRSTAGIALGRSAGFRRHGSLAIVPLRDCPISHPLIGRLCTHLNDAIERETVPDYRGRVRVDVRVVDGGEHLQTCIRPSEGQRLPATEILRPLLSALKDFSPITGVSVLDGAIPRSEHGSLFAPADVGGRPVWLSAVSFFQTNLILLPTLIERLREEATPLAGKRIADVYGGVGLFGLFLADEADVVEFEVDPLAVEAGRLTSERWGLSNLSFAAAPAEDLCAAGHFDVVVVDPPRSGLTGSVIDTLTTLMPPLLLYVSCLPSSLVRDLAPLLSAGYRVEHLELFDFYPQTYHVEALAVLRSR